MKPHRVAAFSAFDDDTSVSRSWKVTGMSAFGGWPAWTCQTGFCSCCLRVLPRIALEKLLVVVDIARDHVEIQPLGRLRLAVHEQRQRFRRGVAQPFVDGEPVALRLRYLLALVVEEQFVVEAFRRRAVERGADLARQLDGIDQVLAGHFIVDAERGPAHRPVRLPLQLAVAAGDRKRDPLFGLGIVIGDRCRPSHRARRSGHTAPRRCAGRSAGTANSSPRAPRATTAA